MSEPAAVPFSRFPMEVLGRIFALVSLDDSGSETSLDITRPPWILREVSAHWASVCVNTPELWTNLRYTFHTYRIGERRLQASEELICANHLKLIKLQLQYSGSFPLTVRLYSNDWRYSTYCYPLCEELMRHSHRLKKFVFANPHQARSREFLNAFTAVVQESQSLPQLEEVDLDLITAPSTFRFPKHCPKLRKITLRYAKVPLELGFPWTQSEELRLVDVDIVNHSLLFDMARNLKHLSVSRCSWQYSGKPVLLPHLETLDSTSTEIPLHCITAPNLRNISYDGRIANLRTMIHCSPCIVQSLHLHYMPPAEDFFTLLKDIPWLKRLRLSFRRSLGDCEFVERMTHIDESGRFKYCPYLTSLHLELYDRVDNNAVISMVEQRRKGYKEIHGGLEEVMLWMWDSNIEVSQEQAEMQQRVKRLVENGLSIQIQDPRIWR